MILIDDSPLTEYEKKMLKNHPKLTEEEVKYMRPDNYFANKHNPEEEKGLCGGIQFPKWVDENGKIIEEPKINAAEILKKYDPNFKAKPLT